MNENNICEKSPEDELWLTGGPLDGSRLHWVHADNEEPQIEDMPEDWYKETETGWVHYELCWFMITKNSRRYAEPRLKYVGIVNEYEVPEEFLQEE